MTDVNAKITDEQREVFTAAAIQLLEENRQELGDCYVRANTGPFRAGIPFIALGSYQVNRKLASLVINHLGYDHLSFDARANPERANVFDGVSEEVARIVENLITLLDLNKPTQQ